MSLNDDRQWFLAYRTRRAHEAWFQPTEAPPSDPIDQALVLLRARATFGTRPLTWADVEEIGARVGADVEALRHLIADAAEKARGRKYR